MSKVKIIALTLALILLVWCFLRVIRGNESAEITLAKKACGLVELDDGWDLDLFSSRFPNFSRDKPDNVIGNNTKIEEWEKEYRLAIDNFSQQAEYAAGAAQIDAKWRSLADAKSEYVYAEELLFAIENDGDKSNLYYETRRLALKLGFKISAECGALASSLNS